MGKQSVAGAIVSMLEANGVDRVFTLAGESYLPLLDQLGRRNSIDVVTCRHEGGAGLMAVADAKLSGRPGVCLVSRGPGAANAALGVLTASEDAVPLILLVGQVEKAHLRRGGFQEVDYAKFYGGVIKWAAELSEPDRAIDVMSRAIHAACSGTPGPVIVALPEDVLAQPVEAELPQAYAAFRSAPDRKTVSEVQDLLAQADRPLLIAGGELASPAGRSALLAAARRWQVPVLVSFRRHDLFPNAHPLYAGELGFFNTPHQVETFHESDLILAAGTRLGDLTTHGFSFPRSPQPAQRLVHVHRDPSVIGRNFVPSIGVAGDSRLFLDALAAEPHHASPSHPGWSERLRRLRSEITTWVTKEAPDGVVFGNVVHALGKHIADDAIITMDAGISAALMYRHYDYAPPQLVLTPITGSMGFGVPAAVAASLRHPDRQVICMIGDGGMLMGGNELAIATERQLPITVILADNRSYGAIRVNLEKAYPGQATATGLSNPDFEKLGQAFGCRTFRIDEEAEVAPVLKEAFSARELTFVVVRTSLAVALP